MAKQGIRDSIKKSATALIIGAALTSEIGAVEATGDELDIAVEEKTIPETEEVIEPAIQFDIYEIPDYPGKKTYMSYKVFGGKSNQKKLQDKAITDENGIRMVDGRYCVAIGTMANVVIGQLVDLVLANGTIIPCIVGDVKAEKDTDPTNTFSPNGCCSEFIVDLTNLESMAKKRGDMSFICEEWQSPVKQIIVYR